MRNQTEYGPLNGNLQIWMIKEDSKQKIIIYGGGFQDNSGFEPYDVMWKYDSARNIYYEIDLPYYKPSARSGHAMVYDSFNQKTILFGGYDEIFGLRNDLWVYDSQSNEWTERSPLVSPDNRQSHAMCFVPVYNKVIILGVSRYSMALLDILFRLFVIRQPIPPYRKLFLAASK